MLIILSVGAIISVVSFYTTRLLEIHLYVITTDFNFVDNHFIIDNNGSFADPKHAL